MKINITLLAVIIFALAAFTGCNKGGSGVAYSMKATIGNNGNTYGAPNCIARPYGNSLLIEGLAGSSVIPSAPYMSITIPNWHDAIDSFPLSTSGNVAQYITSATQIETSFSGVVVINTINSVNISGVFQFMCTDSTQITLGSFVAKRMQ